MIGNPPYVAKSFAYQNHIEPLIFHYSKNKHRKFCTDFVIFEMILLHRKIHRGQNSQNAYKKQTLVMMSI